MDAAAWVALVSGIAAIASAIFAFISARESREANLRLAAYRRPVFEVASLEGDQHGVSLTVRNINEGIAIHVDVHIQGDGAGLIFQRSRQPGVYTGIAGQGQTLSVYFPVSLETWLRLGLEGATIEVEWDTTAEEHQGQRIALPPVQIRHP
jgi:hypothetical protein